MPELPEVETIVRELRKKLSGKKLLRLEIFDRRLRRLRLPLPLKISSVDRHGKYIVVHTKKGKLLLHLRMTGRLRFAKKVSRAPEEKHERARFYFGGGVILKFIDSRRFGTIEWFDFTRYKWKTEKLPELGLNPMKGEFNAGSLKDVLRLRSRAIRSLLLDQKIVAGLGTIYADEALWYAKIAPGRKSDSLTDAEVKRLVASIKRVLRLAIKKGGTTFRDYRKTGGDPGGYQFFRKVYGREGLPCFRCRGKIKRMKIGGRSAHFCPACQK